MSREAPLNYYDILEITPDASMMDIINAYRQAKLAYRTDSLAAYSLFDDKELEQIRHEIEEAYRTLSSPEKRQAYDATLSDVSRPDNARPTIPSAEILTLGDDVKTPAGIRYRMAVATEFPGALLKEIREFKGIDLADIAVHTKISRQYLQAIEEEDSKHFPEPVYLRGYLKQYAVEIGLDGERVANHYPPLQAMIA